MKVLYLCHRIPYPPNKGDKIRAFHQLRAIAALHEVDLFTLADDAADLGSQSALARYCHRITAVRLNPSLARVRALRSLLTRAPATVPYFHSAELYAEVRHALARKSYDRIFVYCSAMAQYVDWVRQVPILIDLVDIDSDKWRQYASVARFPLSLIYRREANRLREYERSVCERSSCVVVSTEREAGLLRQISEVTEPHVVQNGVDTNYFKPLVSRPDWTAPTVAFIGDMSYFPNEEAVTYFARQVLPIIHHSMPNLRFLIVGRNPSRRVRQLQKIGGVEVTGGVEDVRIFLAKSHVSVAPFAIASGIQNKILESMAFGLPVVATTRAVQGLSANVAAVIETGDGAEAMAAKIVRLLGDPQLARELGMESRRRVTADYNWEESLDQLCRLLERAEPPRIAASPHGLTVHSGTRIARAHSSPE
jgi:sugar transferase (PEP-CTERM/EpsH1 system associated)